MTGAGGSDGKRDEPGADRTITVTAQWALWGKEDRGVGYHLLGCSSGPISSENFDQVITRYSPGTLESLPQVTISWIGTAGDSSYVGIAIHDTDRDGPAPPPGRKRAGPAASYVADRDIAQTSYFYVPYEDLAAGAVTYTAMFEAFRAIRLPVGSGRPIPAELNVPGPPSPEQGAAASEQAMRAAALLLTGKPVCVLRAGQAGLAERLRFLDTTAGLLPYGLRSRLSAATWASSTYMQHRLRLFFADAPRRRGDHMVDWDQAGTAPADDPWADQYLAWLREDAARRAMQLARLTEPLGFGPEEVRAIFGRLGIADPAEPAEPARNSLLRPFSRPPDPQSTTAELIRSCAAQLDRPDGGDQGFLAELRQRRHAGLTEQERAGCRQAIRACGLLRADLPASEDLRASLYAALLPVAFGSPLTYDGYCQAEECAGVPAGEVPHPGLLSAVESGDLSEPFLRPLVKVLALAADGTPAAGPALTAARIVRLVAEPELRRHHARIVWGTLLGRSSYLDRPALQQQLRELRFLAPALEEWHIDEPEYQVTVLSVLLRLGYGPALGRPAVQEILEHSDPVPSAALLAALQISMDSGARNRSRLKGLLRWNAGISGPPEWRRERS